PFHSSRSHEIILAPKVYGFDTGFICHYRGWNDLRPDDKGILWEHFVLNELYAQLQTNDLRYWRDKQKHEIDIVIPHARTPIAIECKWKAAAFQESPVASFIKQYPTAKIFVVTTDTPRPYTKHAAGTTISFIGLDDLIKALIPSP
ncbi:MAG: DUF4143 domain-containing protein, partial [Candidatus Omnitrophica bacterium]|nr:DUF4143 domain-containing protein [Candidatus Omnitrophota bacterium]